MLYVPADLETVPFAPAYGAPRLVCYQYDEGGGPRILTRRRGAVEKLREHLERDDVVLVGHNFAYDLAVAAAEGLVELVFRKLQRGQVVCTWVLERLGEISGYSARKNLDFATCCKAHGIAVPDTKGKGYEVEFAQFSDADEIPEPHRSYALNDLLVGKLHARQRARFVDVPERALQRLVYRQFCLQLMSVWGMVTDGDAVSALERDAADALGALRPQAEAWGFVRPNGTRNMKALRDAVEACYGAACPRTPTGAPQTGAAVLEAADSPRLQAFADYGAWVKTLTNDVPNLRASGTGWISTRYGMAETLRTTSSGDKKGRRTGLIAMQNMRQAEGLRECIRPRPGYAFYNVDAKGLELCTFADLCAEKLGRFDMARAIVDAGDPGVVHTRVGAMLAHQTQEQFAARLAAKDALAITQRTRGKNGVFGYLGGMGPKTYVDYIAKLSKGAVKLTIAEATEIRQAIFTAMPDIQAYLRWVGDQDLGDGTFEAELEYGLVRRNLWYSAAANNRFQARAAIAMSEVVIALCEACYVGALSPARPCLFVHDELLIEVPLVVAPDFEREFLRIANVATSGVCQHVPILWEGELCDRYSKKAKRLVGPDGRLQVWSPDSGPS